MYVHKIYNFFNKMSHNQIYKPWNKKSLTSISAKISITDSMVDNSCDIIAALNSTGWKKYKISTPKSMHNFYL